MDVEFFSEEDDFISPRKAIVACNSTTTREGIASLLESHNFSSIKFDNGYTAFKTYSKTFPELVVVGLNLQRLNGREFLKEIGEINLSKNRMSRLIIIGQDNSRETILELLSILKKNKTHVKMSFLTLPWKKTDLLNQLKNLYGDDETFVENIETAIFRLNSEETDDNDPKRLLLSVSEIAKGLRIELGCDQDLSVNGNNAKDYIEQIEVSLFMIPVDHFEFSLVSTAKQEPSSIIGLLLLISGVATKHNKNISFVDVPFGIYQEIEKHGLKEILNI